MTEGNGLTEEDIFLAKVSEQKRRLFGIAFHYLKNEPDALDAVQEATYRAYLKRKSLKNQDRFAPWLVRILINHCINEHKRKRRELPLLQLPEEPGVPRFDQGDKLELELAIEKLKPVYRHIVVLKYMQDMTIAEIASVMDRPESTIKTWLYKSLKQLRKQLGERGWTDHARP